MPTSQNVSRPEPGTAIETDAEKGGPPERVTVSPPGLTLAALLAPLNALQALPTGGPPAAPQGLTQKRTRQTGERRA